MRKKILLTFCLFFIIIAFLPKENIYYKAEEILKEQKVVLSGENTTDILGVFNISDAKIYYDSIKVGKIENIRIFPFVFFNVLNISNANFSDELRNFLPKNIDSFNIFMTAFYPISAYISGSGDFGEISGYINFYSREMKIKLKPTQKFLKTYKSLAREFKKVEGEYVYEKIF